MKPTLAQSAAHGLVWSIGGQGAVVAVQVITFAVLARLITPADFGLVAMVMAIVSIGEVLRDFGLTSAAIQAPSLSHEERSNLFWVNLFIGCALGILFWFSAGVIADFYSNPSLVPVTQVLAFTFLLNGIATQPRANLIRDLRTKHLAIADIVGVLTGMVSGISIALMGHGYWAVVGMQLSRLAVVALLAVVFSRFIPQLPNRHVSIRRFARFGLGIFGTQAMILIAQNAPGIIIGRALGAVPLGFFSRAQNLAVTPLASLTPALQRITLPVLSRLQNEPDRYNAYLVRGQTALLLVSTLAYSALFVYADVVIRIFLGTDWTGATLTFRILCLAGAADALHYVYDWIFVSRGDTSQYFRWTFVARGTLILMVALAAPFSVESVAWAMVLWSVISGPIGFLLAHSVSPLRLRAMLGVTTRAYALFGFVAGTGFGVRWLTDHLSLPVEIALSMSAIAVVVMVVLFALQPFRKDFLSVWDVAKLMRQKV